MMEGVRIKIGASDDDKRTARSEYHEDCREGFEVRDIAIKMEMP